MHGHRPPAENSHCTLNTMLYTTPWVASPPQIPACWAPGCQVCRESTLVHLCVSPVACSGFGGHNNDCPTFSQYNFCTHMGKRHGWSSGMRHGWRSSWSGVRTPVRPSVQGPVGEAPATAPCSIPLHQRYRRCDGWRVSSIFFPNPNPNPVAPGGHTKTKHQTQHTCSSAPRHCYRRPLGGACPPHTPLPLARGRGLELGSSGRRPAAWPLHHAAQNQSKLRSLRPSCLPRLPCSECFSLFI